MNITTDLYQTLESGVGCLKGTPPCVLGAQKRTCQRGLKPVTAALKIFQKFKFSHVIQYNQVHGNCCIETKSPLNGSCREANPIYEKKH